MNKNKKGKKLSALASILLFQVSMPFFVLDLIVLPEYKILNTILKVLPKKFFDPWNGSVSPALGMKSHHDLVWQIALLRSLNYIECGIEKGSRFKVSDSIVVVVSVEGFVDSVRYLKGLTSQTLQWISLSPCAPIPSSFAKATAFRKNLVERRKLRWSKNATEIR